MLSNGRKDRPRCRLSADYRSHRYTSPPCTLNVLDKFVPGDSLNLCPYADSLKKLGCTKSEGLTRRAAGRNIYCTLEAAREACLCQKSSCPGHPAM